MYDTLKEIGTRFCLPGELADWNTITNGNVNSTYKVIYRDSRTETAYVFQRINTTAFHHPEDIMANIDLVTEHIHELYPEEKTLNFFRSEDGHNYCYDSSGSFWRVMNFVESTVFNTCNNSHIIEAVGRAFGHFAMQLSDLDGSLLYDTIPDFHNTAKRLETFFEDVKADRAGRASEATAEIEYIKSVREEASSLSTYLSEGRIPLRVTHNDTKCNNVLFDKETLEPLVVIDYDTIMPGSILYDFGDAVRCIANTAAEDERDLSKISFNLDKFKSFCHGYIPQVKSFLTENEKANLALAAFSVTVELGSRFLADYINGDKYFNIKFPDHNLVRTKGQLALARDIHSKLDAMNEIIAEF